MDPARRARLTSAIFAGGCMALLVFGIVGIGTALAMAGKEAAARHPILCVAFPLVLASLSGVSYGAEHLRRSGQEGAER